MDKLFVAMQLGFNICFLAALLALARGAAPEPAPDRARWPRLRRRKRRPEAVTAPTAAPEPTPVVETGDLDSMVSHAERREATMNRPDAGAAPDAEPRGPSAPAVAELQARIARFRRIRGGDGTAPAGAEDPAGRERLSRSGRDISRPTRAGAGGTRLARVTGMDGR